MSAAATSRVASSEAVAHEVTLTTADGEKVRIACGSEQDVVTAAAAAGFGLPSMCRKGTCGACHATVVEGEYVLDAHSPAVFGPGEEDHGAVLLCRTRPKGPLAIAAPYDSSRIIEGKPPVREGEILAIEEVAAATVRLVVKLGPDSDGGLGAQFEPGQFMQLAIPGETERRAYSIANAANWDGLVELFVKRQPNGWFSSYLERRAKVGDRLVVEGPRGAFGLRETGLRPRWFVAGGTGLSPLLSMLRRMAEWQEPHDARLFFGVNTPSEVFAVAELEELRQRLPGFRYEIRVWRADETWTGEIGTPVDGLRQALATTSARPDVYVCGPPRLIDATHEAAIAHGIDESHVFSERFLPS